MWLPFPWAATQGIGVNLEQFSLGCILSFLVGASTRPALVPQGRSQGSPLHKGHRQLQTAIRGSRVRSAHHITGAEKGAQAHPTNCS